MAVLSLRVDDDLKKSLISEAVKENISLTEYVKKKLTDGLLNDSVEELQDAIKKEQKIKKLKEQKIKQVISKR